jgi:hypothetical protein
MHIAFAAVASIAVVALSSAARAQPLPDFDVIVGATRADGGGLRIVHDFSEPVLVTFSVSNDGLTRWTSSQPGFDAPDPLTETGPDFHPVKNGTPLRVEIVSLDPGASFKLGAEVLDTAGESAFLANAPDLHVHGEWRLILPDGVIGAYQIAVRLTTTSPAYAPSPPYVFTLVNDPDVPVPTTTLPPAGGEQRLVGTKLRLLAGKAPTGRTLAVRSKDQSLAGPAAADDPTITGGSLTLLLDGIGATTTYPLPAAGWSALPRGRGYRYADGAGAAGPMRAVVVKIGRGLSVSGKGELLGDLLAAEPSAVHAILALGARRLCLSFDPTKFKPNKLLVGRDPGASGACPAEGTLQP